MPVRPAVPGLLKHEVILTNRQVRDQCLTIWTYRDVTPVPAARVTYERSAIRAWLSSHWRQQTNPQARAEVIRTKDFGVAPPARYDPDYVTPNVFGNNTGGPIEPRIAAVIALRTQAVGSTIRNRLNGRIAHGNLSLAHYEFSSGNLVSQGKTDLKACYDNLLSRLDPTADANSGDWSVVSFFAGGAVRAVPLVLPVNHIIVRDTAGIQKRRVAHPLPYARGA